MLTLLNIQSNGNTYFTDELANLQAYCNENACLRKDRLVQWSFSYLESLGNRPFWRAENFKYLEFILGTSKTILKRQKMYIMLQQQKTGLHIYGRYNQVTTNHFHCNLSCELYEVQHYLWCNASVVGELQAHVFKPSQWTFETSPHLQIIR